MRTYLASVWQWLADTSAYKSQLEKDQALLVIRFIATIMVIYTIFAVFVPAVQVPGQAEPLSVIQSLAYVNTHVLTVLLMLIIPTLTIGLTRQGYLSIASWGPAALFYLLVIVPILREPGNVFNLPWNVASLIIFMMLVGLLNSGRGLVAGMTIAIVSLLADFGEPNIPVMVVLVLQLLGGGLLIYSFQRFAQISRSAGAEQGNQERLKLAEINTEITRMATQRGNIQDILNRALGLLISNYPTVYHAQVFLVDEQGNRARLVASTGEVGRMLLDRKHSLPIGSLSVIGQTVLNGLPTLAIANAANTIHRPNDLLPNTRVEAAFPLSQNNEVIGALDLQSLEDGAFPDNDLPTFQAIANSLALIIDNIRQSEAMLAQVEERQILAEQARSALREVERLNKRLTARTWVEYMQKHDGSWGYDIDFKDRELKEVSHWDEALASTIELDTVIHAENIIAVPVRVRGHVIGAMEFEFDPDSEISDDDITLIEDISERVGLAAENVRLLRESQRTAQREQLINEVNTRIQRSTTVESTISETARSLSEVLRTQKVSIRLGMPHTQSKSTAANAAQGNGAAQPNGKVDNS